LLQYEPGFRDVHLGLTRRGLQPKIDESAPPHRHPAGSLGDPKDLGWGASGPSQATDPSPFGDGEGRRKFRAYHPRPVGSTSIAARIALSLSSRPSRIRSATPTSRKTPPRSAQPSPKFAETSIKYVGSPVLQFFQALAVFWALPFQFTQRQESFPGRAFQFIVAHKYFWAPAFQLIQGQNVFSAASPEFRAAFPDFIDVFGSVDSFRRNTPTTGRPPCR
jgi:hypothetical protein